MRILVQALMDRPIVGRFLREAMLEYVMHNLPMLNNYVKGIAKFTGLPEEEVRRSRPAREYARRLLGF
jgi:hypothetical protein